jgi:superfamily I DNA/RNA helicase
MHLNDDTTIVYGPPGCGKTRHLIGRVVSVLQDGVPPEYVAYISFTREAVREARDRAIEVTGLDVEKFSGFRTLHSMTYWLLGLGRYSVIDPTDALGSSQEPREVAEYYAHLYSYSRVMKWPLTRTWDALHSHLGDELGFLQWVKSYQALKQRQQKVDFNDMVEDFIAKGIRFPYTWVFIDEAQDFTPLQWAGVQVLCQSADHVVVAGDHNQSIFAWAGAKGNIFEHLEGERQVLQQSYRVPGHVHTIAGRILRSMKQAAVYRPRSEKGYVEWIKPWQVGTAPFKNGETWMILSRHRYQLPSIFQLLREHGVYFRELGQRMDASGYWEGKDERWIRWYEEALAGKELTPKKREKLDQICNMNVQSYIDRCAPWHQAFIAWPINRIKYYLETRSQWGNAKVTVGTFHSSKGLEADNVILLGDCTLKVLEKLEHNVVDELRAVYVAVTRAKKRLYVCEAECQWDIPWYKWIGWPEDWGTMI